MAITEENPGVLEDFSGGLNTLTAANRLSPNQTPSCNSVWADDNALSKRPGQLRTNSGTILGRSYSGYSVHNSVFSGAEQMLIYGSAGIGANFLCYSTLGTDLNGCYTQTAGTVSCPSSVTVTGSGTAFLTGGTYGVGTAAPGAFFVSGTTVGVILTVDSDTQLTLKAAFGTTLSGSAYNILPAWPSANRVSFADMNKNCWITGIGGSPVAWDGSFCQYVNPIANGTITTSTSSTTVTGVGTKFTCISATAITLGYATIATADGSTGVIQSVTNDTTIVLTANYATANAPGTAYTIPNFPAAAYLLPMANYVFAGNIGAYVTAGATPTTVIAATPSLVSWSNLVQPQIWPPANNQPVNPNDGFPIVGLFYDGQSNCILKNNTMWKLSGTSFNPSAPTYTLSQVYTPSDFFINSPKSVQLFETPNFGGFIMLGKNGFYSYNGAAAVSKLLQYDNVRGEFSQVASFNFGNVPTVTAEPASIIVNGSYWLQVPYTLSGFSSTDKELTYVIDKNGAFWQWQAQANGVVSDMCYFLGLLYGVNSYSGGMPGIMKLNYTGTSAGTSDCATTAALPTSASSINGTWTSKLLEFKNQQRFGLGYVYYKIQTPITPAGTVTTAVASATVTGTSTNFYSTLVPGATITVNGTTGTVLTVNSNTSLTLTGNFGALNTTQAYTVAGGYNLTFGYSINGGAYTTTAIDMTTGAGGGGTTGKSATITIGQIGRTLQLQVSNNVAGQVFEIYGIEFDYQGLRQ